MAMDILNELSKDVLYFSHFPNRKMTIMEPFYRQIDFKWKAEIERKLIDGAD